MEKEEIQFYKENILFDNEASYAPFGYTFQADAGLYLFCHYYKEAESITIESQLQDIEIKKKDGKYILAQAKAAQSPYNCSDYGNKLSDALFSLAKHCVHKDDTLIYVTNIPNVFGEEMKNQFNDIFCSYKDLSSTAKQIVNDKMDLLKEKIKNKINDKNTSPKIKKKLELISMNAESLNYENLYFISISRYKDDDQNRPTITAKMASLLSSEFEIDNSNKIALIIDDLFKVWHEMFFINSTINGAKKDKKISKEEFCWPIITINNMRRSTDEICDYLDGEYDDNLGYMIEEKRNEYIKRYDYELINDILFDYKDYRPKNYLKKMNEYIIENWDKYSSYFKHENPLVEKGATIYYLYSLLSDHNTIKKVLKGKNK